MVSRLIDKGREVVLVWPNISVVNDRGDVKPMIAEEPVPIRCSTSEDRSQIADLPGNIDIHILKVTARKIPLGPGGVPATWARIMYQGQEYDMAEPPRLSKGPSRSIEHWEFKLRSRANLSPVGTQHQRDLTVRGPQEFGPVGEPYA